MPMINCVVKFHQDSDGRPPHAGRGGFLHMPLKLQKF